MRHRHAADPRDYLYAMLGLIDEDLRTKLCPDYHLSVEETHKRFEEAMQRRNPFRSSEFPGAKEQGHQCRSTESARAMVTEIKKPPLLGDSFNLEGPGFPLVDCSKGAVPEPSLQNTMRIQLQALLAPLREKHDRKAAAHAIDAYINVPHATYDQHVTPIVFHHQRADSHR